MSLHIAYDAENIFARILRGEIPNHTIFDDAHCLGFMDAFPQSRGHCLIVPKEAATNILTASPQAVQDVIARTQKLAMAVEKALSPDGIVITQFNGAPAGQTVFHLHFHVIPRYADSELAGHGKSGRADEEELASLASQIRQAYAAL
jgi:histidine triad (HIT) family protein